MSESRSRRSLGGPSNTSDSGLDDRRALEPPANPIMSALTSGALGPNHRDRDFTTFLDLKKQYHYEFMTRLNEHVEEDYGWQSLESYETARMECASEFVAKYGRLYWGEENRNKYLMLNVAAAELCVYPTKKEE